MKKSKTDIIQDDLSLNQILESVNAFVYRFAYNDEGNVIAINYISSNIHSIYKLTDDEYKARITKGTFNELFDPLRRDEIVNFFHSSLKAGKKGSIRYYLTVKDQKIWVEEKVFPKLNDEAPHTVFGIVQNITAEVIDEQEKEASEKKYQLLFNRNLAGVYRTHVNGDILECNKAFSDILGFDSVDELKKLKIQEIYVDDDGSIRREYIKRLRKVGFLSNYISFLKDKKGKNLVLNNNVGIFPDENGELNIIEGTLVDITHEYEANRLLAQNELKYKLLFNESNISILLLKYRKGKLFIEQANKNAVKLFEAKKEEELTQKEISKFIDTDLSDVYDKLKKKNKFSENRNLKTLNNKTLNGELFFSYVEFDRQELIQLVIKDVTIFNINRIQLENSQRNFKNIVDTSPSAIFIFSDENLMYANTNGKKLIKNDLKSNGSTMNTIFSKEHYGVFKHMARTNIKNASAYVEIEMNRKERFAVRLVNITYNDEPAILISLTNVTLQYEFNTQKLRAEIAEELNFSLEQEIQKHKKTQEELIEKSSRLRAFVDSSQNLYISTLNNKFLLTSMNKNFHSKFSFYAKNRPEIGDNLFDLLDTNKRSKRWFKYKILKSFTGENQVLTTKFPTKNNKELWLEIFINPILVDDKKPKEISLVAHDITDKIENERKIKASESRNKALLQSIPDLIYRVTKDGVFTDFKSNQSIESELFFEFTKTREIIGKNMKDIFISEKTASDFLEDVRKTIESDELLTHYFKIKSNRQSGNRVFFYENRYSKINDNEVLVIARNVTDHEENEARLKESLEEKEILLKEVHHRVKNNLQVINSILNLQSSYIDDPSTLEFINESQNRIRSMSFIHESLYLTENFSSINFYDYITNLVNNLFSSYQTHEDRITLKLDVTKTHLVLDQAIPCGLILNELLSNSLKYAFPENKKGEILVELKEEDKKIKLRVSDNGVGLPPDLDLNNLETLGLNLVEILTEQLDGNLEVKTKSGTEFLIIFDKEEA